MVLIHVRGDSFRFAWLCVIVTFVSWTCCDARWRNIRVQPHLYQVEKTLNSSQIAWLSQSINSSVVRVQQVLNIYDIFDNQTSQPFVLPRSNYCKTVNSHGNCSEVYQDYLSSGQQCSETFSFQIPDDHLQELLVYDRFNVPKTLRRRGAGVSNADFILYVSALPVGDCASFSNVNAFSSYCSGMVQTVGEPKNRPYAGYINICPQFISAENVTNGKLVSTVLHEMIHVLGFSTTLFSSYQNCSKPALGRYPTCNEYSFEAFRTIRSGTFFISTPKVLKFANEHFGCSSGIPLHMENGKLTSHWDSTFMYSSIMQPYITSGSSLFLDGGTLSLLEDTGWYRANFSLADRFIWGAKAGCEFFKTCSALSADMFCTESATNAQQCDFFHMSTGNCSQISGSACFAVKSSTSCGGAKNDRCLTVQTLSGSSSKKTGDDVGSSIQFPQPSCFNVTCNSDSYTVSSSLGEATCSSTSSTVKLSASHSVICVQYSRMCPLLTSLQDLVANIPQTTTVNPETSTFSSSEPDSTTQFVPTDLSTLSSTPESSTLTTPPQFTISTELSPGISSSASSLQPFTTTKLSFLVFRAFIGFVAFAKSNPVYGSSLTTLSPLSSINKRGEGEGESETRSDNRQTTTTTTTTTTTVRFTASPKKFEIRFSDMDFHYFQSKNQIEIIKQQVRSVLAKDVFGISEDLILVTDVYAGSVVVVFQNTDPSASDEQTLDSLKQKVSVIKITMEGKIYGASSVGYMGQTSNSGGKLRYTEIIVGCVVGGLMLIGLVVVISLTITKHKLRGVRQVRPETASPPSSNNSREASATIHPASGRQTVGLSSTTPTNLADVEAPGQLQSRGISAGSIQIGLTFPSSALYFEETV